MKRHLSLSHSLSLSCTVFERRRAKTCKYKYSANECYFVLPSVTHEQWCGSGSLSNTIKPTKQQPWWLPVVGCGRTQAPGSPSSIITCCSMLSTGRQANNHMRTVKSALLHVFLMLFLCSCGFLCEKLTTTVLWAEGGCICEREEKHLCLRVCMAVCAHAHICPYAVC